MKVPELFRTQGEPAFRRFESDALAGALKMEGVVLAMGGSVPELGWAVVSAMNPLALCRFLLIFAFGPAG